MLINRPEDMDYSISLNGIFAAQRNLEQAVRRIATPNATTDYAAESINVDRAKIAEKANLRVISVQHKLDDSILDIFA